MIDFENIAQKSSCEKMSYIGTINQIIFLTYTTEIVLHPVYQTCLISDWPISNT
jgi:hypothetical protein